MQSRKQTKTRKTSVTFLAEFDKLLVFFVAQAYAQHVAIPVPWAPARGGQGEQPPTLEKIRVGHAHPGNINRGLKTFRQ